MIRPRTSTDRGAVPTPQQKCVKELQASGGQVDAAEIEPPIAEIVGGVEIAIEKERPAVVGAVGIVAVG